MQHTMPYTLQHNGVIECKKYTLKDIENHMVQFNHLVRTLFWFEAINYAKYSLNHTPTKVVLDVTLEEDWSKINLDVSHFKVFWL